VFTLRAHMIIMKSTFITRRKAIALSVAGIASLGKAQAGAKQKLSLVELFTSQGCSSCPPADRLAGELAKRDDVIVLSYNVDYWDYLGWRDTLAKPEYSQRQYDYAHARGDGNVYTPQMIFNGSDHTVGSNAQKVEKALATANPLSNIMQIKRNAEEISVSIEADAAVGDATLWLFAVAPKLQQAIARGENAGESIAYYNVVRNMVPAAMIAGGTYEGSWRPDTIITKDAKFCVAVLQQGKTGRVLAVARA
jgi:hypothetical protein